MADNVAGATITDDTLVVTGSGSAVPIVVSVNDGVCSVSAMATNGKPIAAVKVIDRETGAEVPVNIFTCTEAVVCNEGIPMQTHLRNLYDHAGNADAHLTAAEKHNLETKKGAQDKAATAKAEAIAAASLETKAAQAAAAEDATAKANAARDAAYKYADKVAGSLDVHEDDNNNPHNVTAAQVGLGNVPNKATNDLQPTYTEAASLTNISSGERLAVAFGKIKKAISSLISHIGNNANPHNVTAAQVGALSTSGGSLNGLLKVKVGYGVASEISAGNDRYLIYLSAYDYIGVGYDNAVPIKLDGSVLLTTKSYGSSLPSTGEAGQLFFLKD